MSRSERETTNLVFQALKELEGIHGKEAIQKCVPLYSQGYRPADYLYVPDQLLMSRIADYIEWRAGRKEENLGRLMEEISMLAFRCLKGWDSIKSYQSYASQLDLVISGSDVDWAALLSYLHLDLGRTTIIIEAKNLDHKVDDQQFKRLCYIVENEFVGTASLGIFITRYGASGFPRRDGKRLRALRDAQATQLLFHARTEKYVIVFDEHDLLGLVEPGGLPRLMEAKMRAVEQWTGMAYETATELKDIDLPPHLSKYSQPAQDP